MFLSEIVRLSMSISGWLAISGTAVGENGDVGFEAFCVVLG